MRALARKRKADRALNLGPLGISADIKRVFAIQTRSILDESIALKLPVDFYSVSPDLGAPLGGDFRMFIIGMDPIGGSYVIP